MKFSSNHYVNYTYSGNGTRLTKKYYQNADGIFLLFDTTNQNSFQNVKKWLKDIQDNIQKNISNKDKEEIIIYLIGNKIDMIDDRIITKEMAEKQAKELGLKYYEVSCKYNINVNDVMVKMILNCFSKLNGIQDAFQLQSVKKKKKKNKKGCC